MLYSIPAAQVTYELVRQFVLDAEAANLFTESLTFEAKERRSDANVVEAVSALSNTDGGLVLVGVKDRDATGEDRIVGVPRSEHDAVVSQLHSLIPNAMPEVIPVAKRGTDRLVLVLRVDADAVLHPVMVRGKVLYRLPGQKAPADRARVIDMIARDSAAQQSRSGPMQIAQPSWRPQDISLWPEPVTPFGDIDALPSTVSGELRVVGGLTLPQRILGRPWLNTRAKQAALDMLNNAPLRNSPIWVLSPWTLTEAGAGFLRYESSPSPRGLVYGDARAYVRLVGRHLAVLVSFRWLKLEDGRPFKLDLGSFQDALLACMITSASTCAHVAKSLDVAAPSEPRTWEAWLTGDEDNVLNAVDISRYHRDSRSKTARAFFPPTKVPTNDPMHLDRVVRDWLTYWLLEIGTRSFEDLLEHRAVEGWVRWPDLA
jgi:hypothetical protein